MSEDTQWKLEMESRVSKAEGTLESLDHTINGNGQPGFVREVTEYMSEQRGAWKAILRIGGIVAFFVMALLGWLTYRDAVRHSDVREPQTFISEPKQDAKIPRVR